MSSTQTMKALVFYGPYDVRLENTPIPRVLNSTDAIIKTTSAALCGSELHRYRGNSMVNMDPGYICGHEGAGIVQEAGSDVKDFKVGDYVVATFTTNCGSCFNCNRRITGRCVNGTPFGGVALDGSQAQYFRVPMADTTLHNAPAELGELVVLMADIYPTGFYGAKLAFDGCPKSAWQDMSVAMIGCGPVGICAIISALEYKPKQVFAIDSVPERLERARALGCIPLNYMKVNVKEEIMNATSGNGVDSAIELVGLSPALKTALNVVATGGKICSIGVHGGEMPFSAADCYNKNVTIHFGRCPVRAVFDEAVVSLRRNQKILEKMKFIDLTLPALDESFSDALRRFNEAEVNKVVFKPHGFY